MKKILISLLLILLRMTSASAQEKTSGIIFQPLTYNQAIEKAAKENKLVFLHGYATWCHFCEFMKDSVYPDKTIGDFYNKNFICVQMDMEKDGRDLLNKLHASSYPQLIFTDGTGTIVHRIAGQKQKDAFLQLGKDALDPLKQTHTYEVKYKNRTMTDDEAAIYFRQLAQAAVEYQPIVDNYLMRIPDSAFTSLSTWRLINEFLREVDMPSMSRFLKMRKEFVKKYSSDSVDNRIINNYNASAMMLIQKVDTNGYNSLLQKLKASDLDLKDKIIAYAEMNKYRVRSQWPIYLDLAPAFVETFCKDDFRRTNEISYNIYERGQNNDIIKKAEGWMSEIVKKSDNFRYFHTYACLSYKLGKKDQALEAALKAVELGKKTGTDMKQTLLLIDKIKEL